MNRFKACLVGQAHTKQILGFNTPTNDSREWMRILNGDVLNYQEVAHTPKILSPYHLVMVELTPKTHRLPRLIKKHHPEIACIGLVEGRVEYVVRSPQDMEGLFEFCQVVDDVDMLGILVARTLSYYRLYVDRPEKVQWVGIPYPVSWARARAAEERTRDRLLIELGSAMDSRNGIANLFVLKKLQKNYPAVTGLIFNYYQRELAMINDLGIKASFVRPRSWWDYFPVHLQAFATLVMDDRRCWGRYALDCAAADIPFVGSNLSHCNQTVAKLTCDPFDTDTAYEHLERLIDEYYRGEHEFYAEVTAHQQRNLAQYAAEPMIANLMRSLRDAGQSAVVDRYEATTCQRVAL